MAEVVWSAVGLLLKVVKSVGDIAVDQLTYGIDDILHDLRAIRFNDTGVIKLIEDAIDDVFIDENTTLINFHDFECEAADAARRLVKRIYHTSRLTHEELQLIGWRKPEIREQVKEQLFGYGQEGFVPDKEELRKLLEAIRELNSEIDEVEHDLIARKR